MAPNDRLQEAVDELYGLAPADFTGRRGELADAAKHAGDAAAAKAIGELRRPTQSAWTVNRLVRSDAGVTGELADLGQRLRAAERALDGNAMRELSTERRRLVGDLVARAFAVTDQTDPSAALRDEVTATLDAALADPDVAAQLESGSVLRAARWSGFGAGGPGLTAVPSRSTSGASGARRRAKTPDRSEGAARRAAEREREQDHQRRLGAARDRLATAKRDQARQKQRSDRLRREVETLRQRLDEARTQLGEAEGALRVAERDRQNADRALTKLLGDPKDG